jgi:hypothetical protein
MSLATARSLYPTSPDQIEAWAQQHELPIENVERRYAHFIALRSLADAPWIRDRVVVQGSTVAAYVFDSGRAPRDIDLLVRNRHNDSIPEDERRELIQRASTALSAGTRKFCPDFDHWRDKLREHIHVEFFGPIAPFREMPFAVDPASTTATLMVLDFSSLLATKYHALFRSRLQGIKRANHAQDVFDIASLITRNRPRLDAVFVLRQLVNDPRHFWSPGMSNDEVFNSELRQRAESNYDSLRSLTGDHFIEFPQAWRVVKEDFQAISSHLDAVRK